MQTAQLSCVPRKSLFRAVVVAVFFLFITVQAGAQIPVALDLERAIQLAQAQSIDAMMAKNTFLANYWTFRAYKAEQLPSLNFQANLANFDRSIRPLQDAMTGEILYRENYNFQNSASLSIDQNIVATGGKVSLSSSLTRLDQFKPSRSTNFYTQPVTISYIQPIWNYNRFKWDKKVEPLKYEMAKKDYLESMESITVKAVSLFFDALLCKISRDISVQNYANTKTMFRIASERFQLGSVKKNDLLQLELRMINDSLSINENELLLSSRLLSLRSFLGFNEQVNLDLLLPEDVPDLVINGGDVLACALENSSFRLEQDVKKIEAERTVAMAKGNRGFSVQARTQFGLSNSSSRFQSAYMNLLDQEIFGLSVSVPIMDWGMGKGRVMVARSRMETTKNEIAQAVIDYEQNIHVQVMKFNNQQNQCRLAKRANEIASERYNIAMENFKNGLCSVTDLNISQNEKDDAQRKSITAIYDYWNYYYGLRKMSLYDYVSKVNISAEFDKLLK